MKTKTVILMAALVGIGIAAVAVQQSANARETDAPLIDPTHPVFPNVSGKNLENRKFDLPKDFGGERNLVILAWEREQQREINTWLPIVKALEAKDKTIRYYEVPVIERLPALAQSFIDGGMTRGIPNKADREHTITLYIDKAAFRRALLLPTEKEIYLLLLDKQGKVLWQTSGAHSKEKERDLEAALKSGRSLF